MHFMCKHHCVDDLVQGWQVCKMQLSSYKNIIVLCSRNACQCHAELCDAMGNRAKEFKGGQMYLSAEVSTTDKHHRGCSASINTDMLVAITE